MIRKRILVIDDDLDFFQDIEFALSTFRLEHATNLRAAGAMLQSHDYDLVLLDMQLKPEAAPSDSSDRSLTEFDGLSYIPTIRNRYPILPIIVMSKYKDHALVAEAIKLGARDYFYKPDQELSVWRNRIHELTDAKRLKGEQYPFLGESPEFVELKERLIQLKDLDDHLLIQGEKGVGKTSLARYYHAISRRAFLPFQKLDITSYDDEAHVQEFLETVKGGVVFLHRIDRISPRAQAFLARHLDQQKQGGTKVNVQFLASAPANLKELVQQEAFRSDLYYHFRRVEILPLRRRPADIAFLLNHYLKQQTQLSLAQTVTPEAKQILLHYDYPDNVRELISIVQHLVSEKNLRGEHRASPECLPRELLRPAQMETPFELSDFRKASAQTELRFINQALRQTYGQKSKAAELLGVKLDDLRYTVNKYFKAYPDLFDEFLDILANYQLK